MNVLVLSGENHRFNASAPVVAEFLASDSDLTVESVDDKEVLRSLDGYAAVVFGTGFTRGVPKEDGTLDRVPDLSPDQEEGLYGFVAGGGGLVGQDPPFWCSVCPGFAMSQSRWNAGASGLLQKGSSSTAPLFLV